MHLAIEQARIAETCNEVPIGAVLIDPEGKIKQTAIVCLWHLNPAQCALLLFPLLGYQKLSMEHLTENQVE